MWVFAATIGLSAFLLFLVQPIIAKQILPWFGGSAAVWTTCMVFFQVTLLAGYFYSDQVIRKLQARQQAWVHGSLLLLSLLVLPITASDRFKPADADNPAGRILLLLAVTIGLPYLMLSTTGPLVQAWFARRFAGTPSAASVWRLYALSNIASMLALVSYPPLIEPAASARWQSVGWSLGYGAFVLLALGSAWLATRPLVSAPVTRVTEVDAQTPAATAAQAAEAASPPTTGQQMLWLLLAALGSVMLLTVTTHVTQNIASVPFLWVLPLALYLISFILTFDGRGWYWRKTYHAGAALLLALMMGGLSYRPNHDWTPDEGLPALIEAGLLPLNEALPLYAVGLFVLCMFFHGELVHRKPAPQHLTRFYLMVSLGGAVGGLLVGIAAPLLLNWTWELPGALMVSALVLLGLSSGVSRASAAVALLLAGWGCSLHVAATYRDTIEVSRNFYGTLRVKATATDDQPDARWRLLHGVIAHGEQYRQEPLRKSPTTYYGESSGVGRGIEGLRALSPGQPQRIGLIGLGVGTLAAYGREGDSYRFYELNPAVLELAERRFSYLTDTKARIETLLGDARLVLERESPQGFDLLAVDAFSSDSIPVHLLTREALAVYRRHLREGGVVAFHISNRYLNLKPVVQQMAEEAGMTPLLVADDPESGSSLYRSDWVLVTTNAALLQALKAAGHGEPLAGPVTLRPWTDDFNNLFDVLK